MKKAFYYSTIMSFHQIRSRERAKYRDRAGGGTGGL